jgi:ABC-2 type transport system permease protein
MFYATPIIYPLAMVINVGGEKYAKLLLLNPVAQIIQDARHNVIEPTTPTIWTMSHNPAVQIIPIASVVVITIIAVLYFKKSSKRFTELV